MSDYDYSDEYDDPSLQAGYTAATPEDEAAAYFYADPVGVTNYVVQQAAATRANELAQAYGAQLGAIHNQYAGAIGEQSGLMADEAMRKQYGDEYMRRRSDVANYISSHAHVYGGADINSPQVAADVLEGAFLAVRHEAQQRDDAAEWERVRAASSPLDGF